MNKILSKKRFCEIINILKETRKLEEAISNTIKQYRWATGDESIDRYGLVVPETYYTTIELLSTIMEDEMDDILYFCEDLNFGEDYQPGDVVEGDREIDFSTADKLYDYLVGTYHPFQNPMEDDLK